MQVRNVTEAQAHKALRALGLATPFLGTMTVSNGTHEAMICDYSRMRPYTVRYAIGIYRSGHLVARLNIMKED